MKRKLVFLAGILIFSFAVAIGANAQDKGTQQKKETKKELTDKQLRKELGLTKAEFKKIPEKCKNCPKLKACKGTEAAKSVKKKEGETAEVKTEKAVRQKKVVKK